MKKATMALALSFVFMVGLGIFTTQVKAAELKWKVTSSISNSQRIAVPDEEGHALGVFERKGSATFEDGEIATLLVIGSTDITKDGQGGIGYNQFTFKDGSTIWSKHAFTGRTPPLYSMEMKGEFIKGTGRFEGIKGSYTCKGSYNTPSTPDKNKGDLILECSGTSILPHK